MASVLPLSYSPYMYYFLLLSERKYSYNCDYKALPVHLPWKKGGYRSEEI